ncbi:MAG: hypothetical protein JSU77_09775 [Fidelibacterota bacterium]|nr:MAG: hypothetical protein JSU77_09775 [Candidatus Neomarinimicrobiota bacterium]
MARSFADSDIVSSRYLASSRATDWKIVGNGQWERIDEWGNTWGRVDATSKGQVVRGVLDELSRADKYEFPDYSESGSYTRVEEVRSQYPDRWLIGELPGFAFGIARKLRKLENYLVDLLGELEKVQRLHDRIDTLLEKMIVRYADAGVDSVMFWEDWGTQDQLFISPQLWREEFQPRFRDLCHLAHKRGLKVFMHSCGQMGAIVPDLMAVGIDVLQLDQPDLHGIDQLEAYQKHGRITFWCPVDIRDTLQTRDEARIRSRAREMLDRLWKGRGGFIAGFYEDNASIGLDPRWQGYACEEFIRHGVRLNYAEGEMEQVNAGDS